VIGVSGVLLVVEFLADKFPLVNSVWDSIHTCWQSTEAGSAKIVSIKH
jgi:hypothetical protein